MHSMLGNRHPVWCPFFYRSTYKNLQLTRYQMPLSDQVLSDTRELCEAVRSVSGLSAVVTLLQSEDSTVLVPAGWILGGGVPGEAELTEPAQGDSPGARALALGVTLVYSESDNPPDDLPLWASTRGFTTGLVLPLIKHQLPFGAVYALRRDIEPPGDAEINLAELAVAHGSRMLPVLVNRLTSDPDGDPTPSPAIYESVRDLVPLTFDGLQIDPLQEQAKLGEVEISLSRTEFLMLYTLGSKPNEIVPHHVLLEMCWPNDFPALSAVDATVYRLRKKLSRAAEEAGKQIVKTVRGEGYMLATDR